jgi:hypothetical protein
MRARKLPNEQILPERRQTDGFLLSVSVHPSDICLSGSVRWCLLGRKVSLAPGPETQLRARINRQQHMIVKSDLSLGENRQRISDPNSPLG